MGKKLLVLILLMIILSNKSRNGKHLNSTSRHVIGINRSYLVFINSAFKNSIIKSLTSGLSAKGFLPLESSPQ